MLSLGSFGRHDALSAFPAGFLQGPFPCSSLGTSHTAPVTFNGLKLKPAILHRFRRGLVRITPLRENRSPYTPP
jgi:hypothetical protein